MYIMSPICLVCHLFTQIYWFSLILTKESRTDTPTDALTDSSMNISENTRVLANQSSSKKKPLLITSSCNHSINMRTHRWAYGPCYHRLSRAWSFGQQGGPDLKLIIVLNLLNMPKGASLALWQRREGQYLWMRQTWYRIVNYIGWYIGGQQLPQMTFLLPVGWITFWSRILAMILPPIRLRLCHPF